MAQLELSLAGQPPGAHKVRMDGEGHPSLFIRHVGQIVEKLARDAPKL